MADVIGIFTSKDLQWIKQEGGFGYWVINSKTIQKANVDISKVNIQVNF